MARPNHSVERGARLNFDVRHSMENCVFGNLSKEGLEVVGRNGRYFVRYDAGAHQTAWREDEITSQEFEQIKDKYDQYHAIIGLQKRLRLAGIDPYQQNWTPSDV